MLLKYIIISFLLTFNVFAQSKALHIIFGDRKYQNPETQIYLNAMVTPISEEQSFVVDTLVTLLKDSCGVTLLLEQFELIYLGQETLANSVKNLVKRQFDGTVYGTVDFLAYYGYQSAASAYINTNFIPRTHATVLSQNNSSFSVYFTTPPQRKSASGSGLFFSNYYDILRLWDGDTTRMAAQISANSGIQLFPTKSYETRRGFFLNSRTGATSVVVYHNNLSGLSEADASVNLSDYTGILLSQPTSELATSNTAYGRMSWFAVGKSVDSAKRLKIYNCVQWYMRKMGVAYEP